MKHHVQSAGRRVREKQEAAALLSRFSLELLENRKLLLCGCRGISSYSESLVVLQTDRETVTVRGSSLSLCWAGEEKILLVGRFLWIGFGAGASGEGGAWEK